MQKDDLITSKFRVQLPSVLQPASPALAAFHATRARLLLHPGPEADVLKSTNCTKCGAYLLDGTGSIRAARKSRRGKTKSPKGKQPYVRVLHRSCGMCGCEEDLPLAMTKPAAQQVVQKGVATSPKPKPELPSQGKTGSVQSSSTSTPIIAQSRSSSFVPSGQPPQASSAAPSSQPSHTPASAPTSPLPSAASTKPSTPSKLSPAPAQGARDARPKPRPKKKTGLQDMLARNRERQEQDKKAASGGLATFLQGL